MFVNLRRKSMSLGIGAEYIFKDCKQLGGVDVFWKAGV